MKKASKFIKSSATFTRVLCSFSVIKVTSKPKKREMIFKVLLDRLKFLSADLAERFASFINRSFNFAHFPLKTLFNCLLIQICH